MEVQQVALIAALFFLISTLYSPVGHGGASGYIAVMGLLNLPTDMIRPVALTLNIIVAGLGTIRFARAGHLDWKAALPLVATSVPLAFLGGTITLPTDVYRPLLGVLLLISAAHLIGKSVLQIGAFELAKPRIPRAGGLSVGGMIGFTAGLSGIGGGVLLSPLMLILKWANVRQTAAIAAVFIVVNSSSGLAGNIVSLQRIPSVLPIWAAAVLIGGWIGAGFGAERFSPRSLVSLLAAALIIAATKFIVF